MQKPPVINDPPLDQDALRFFNAGMEEMRLKHLFFRTMLRRLQVKEAPGFGTIGVNMKEIIYDPDFIKKQRPDEMVGVLCHESLHLIFGHPIRIGTRDPFLWNIAGDYVINIFLHDLGIPLPPTICLNAKYQNWTTEEVYDDLLEQVDKIKQILAQARGKTVSDGQGGQNADSSGLGVSLTEANDG